MGGPFGQAAVFLIDTLFWLYILAVLLRFLFQLVRADFYNPFSQALVAITNPPLLPLRRMIPCLYGIDFAALPLWYDVDELHDLRQLHVRLQGAKTGDGSLHDLDVPGRHVYVLEGMPRGAPYNVGQMYYHFGQAIRTGVACEPNFDTAVELHRFLDAIRESSDQDRQVAVT